MSELEKCCGLVIAAGLATGHADTHIELMEEVLAQCINAGPNVRAQAERIAELEAEIERLKDLTEISTILIEQYQKHRATQEQSE